MSSDGNPGRPLHTNGTRGSHVAGSMDRSASFRDKMENPILSSLSNMSRTTSTATQGDVTNFVQCLPFDPKSMATEYKFNRHGDFRRLANDALVAPNGSPEDLKRLRAGLRGSSIKGGERVKIFDESLSVANKFFPNVPTKRSRTNALSGVAKMGPPTSVIYFEQPKVKERGNNTIPNKRARTSMADMRPNTPARSSVSVEKAKEVLRGPTSNGVQGEDRVLPVVTDGWEKAKMKKKCSVIKIDAASSLTKSNDRYREPKQGLHPRNLLDSRSRLTDSHGYRSGAPSMAARSSIPNPEQESANIRAVNKVSFQEDFIAGSLTNIKLHATARGPSSVSGVVPKLSPVVQRVTASNDWELPHNTSKTPGAVGPTNRKRTLSTSSSSPPVAQWADRRPQKISRTARRTNLVPVVSSNEEITSLDIGSENGPGFARRFSVNSPQESKSKGDRTSSFALLEIKESVVAKNGQNVQKVSNLVIPTRKNKLVNGNNRRTGRLSASTRFSVPVGAAKQPKTAKLSFNKPESVHSKLGQPPTRRLSDRKAYTRQKRTLVDHALSTPFWQQMETLFEFPTDTDISYLKQQGSIQSTTPTTKPVSLDVDSSGDISLCQRLLSALISEEDDDNGNDDIKLNGYGSTFEGEIDIETNVYNRQSLKNLEFNGLDAFSGYGKKSTGESRKEPVHTHSDHQLMSMNDKLLFEIQSIGRYPQLVPDLAQNGDIDIDGLINDLENKHNELVSRKKSMLDKLLTTTTETKVLQEKEYEQHSIDRLTRLAYLEYMSCWGPNVSGGKSASSKLAKQAALANVKQTLDQCREFKTTGKICFTEPLTKEMKVPGSSSHFNDFQPVASTDVESGQHNSNMITFGKPNLNGAKGKRSVSSNVNGERNAKTKIRQKMTASINGPLAKIADQIKPILSSVSKNEIKNKSFVETVEEEEPVDFSHLEIPEMDALGDGFGEQGQDLGLWLNIDDDVLQDDDFMGLEIPMDDLSEITMTV